MWLLLSPISVICSLLDKDIAAESELAVEPELVPEGGIGEDKGRESALPSSIDVNHLPTEYVELELSYEDFIADEAQVDDTPEGRSG